LVDHDTLSETAEVLVNNEGLAIPSLLKVQSVPLGNLGGAAFMLSKITLLDCDILTAQMQRRLMATR